MVSPTALETAGAVVAHRTEVVAHRTEAVALRTVAVARPTVAVVRLTAACLMEAVEVRFCPAKIDF